MVDLSAVIFVLVIAQKLPIDCTVCNCKDFVNVQQVKE